MKKVTLVSVMLATVLFLHANGYSQGFLKKIKDKASEVANNAIDKKVDKAVGIDPASPAGNSARETAAPGGRGGKPLNKVGEGLKNSTPPDVNQQIGDAEAANAAGNFSEARYSVQQALLGIELQMGREILKSLPATVSGLAMDTTEDRVISTQWGWSNLTIQRVYGKDDKQFTIVVGNNSMYSGLMNILFAGNISESNGQTQNFKQVKIKGNKAMIKFEQNEGYTVLVQIGQSGMITFQGINFATEQDMMNALNTVDINGVKKMLGEK